MKTSLLLAVSALALPLAACGPKVPPARAALECPATEGDLTRTSVSPDGKACTYATPSGAEVTLQLVSVQGGVEATLGRIEANLLAGRGEPEAAAGAPATEAEAAEARSEAISDAERAAREAAQDTSGVDVEVSLGDDGKTHIVTEDGGTTRVNLPGIHIVADDDEDTAKVKIGPLTVDAGDDSATVRMRRDVRLRGEALNPEKRGMRALFIYTGDDLPDGYRFVGYEAGGPKRGPIAVAVVKSRDEGPDGGELYPDVKKLVRRNGGV